MMADCILDANVLVAYLDATDSLHGRASELIGRLGREGYSPVLADIVVGEAISVLARRFEQRRRSAELPGLLDQLGQWLTPDAITWLAPYAEQHYAAVIDLVGATHGRLNFNDALLVVLQRQGLVPAIATFDADFEEVEGIALVR